MSASITTTREGRINLVQIFRALAIIAVVMIHTTPTGIWQVFCRPFLNFAVPTFLFLSGYLTRIDNHDWPAFCKKRITRVLIPYIIWTVLFTLTHRQFGRLPEHLLKASAGPQMYYIFVYIQFVLLTPLLGRLAKSKYHLLGYLVAPVSILATKYYWLLTGLKPSVNIAYACLGWFTFYYLGLVLGNRIVERRYSLKALAVICMVTILLQIAEGYWWWTLDDTSCGTVFKLTALLTNSIFMLIAYTILKDGRYDCKSRILKIIGDYSFGIYLCHFMVIWLLRSAVPFYRSIPYPITSAIVLLTSLFCCYVGDRICGDRLSRWLGLR